MNEKVKMQPIQFQRKIRNPKLISVITKLSSEWGISNQDVIFRMITEGLMRESKKMEIA